MYVIDIINLQRRPAKTINYLIIKSLQNGVFPGVLGNFPCLYLKM